MVALVRRYALPLVCMFFALILVGVGFFASARINANDFAEGKNPNVDSEMLADSARVLETNLSLIPVDSLVQASHMSLSAVAEPSAWWDYYRKLFPLTFRLPAWDDFVHEGVVGVTYASYVTNDLDYDGIAPFSYQLVLAMAPGSSGEEVFVSLAEGVGESGWVRKVDTGDRVLIVVFDSSAFKDLSPLFETDSLGVAVVSKISEPDRELAELFSLNKTVPTFYFNFGAFFDRLGDYIHTLPEKEAWGEAVTAGLGIGLGEGDAVWVGEISRSEPNLWVGGFIDGNIDGNKVDPKRFGDTLDGTISFLPGETGVDPESGLEVETGTVQLGLSLLLEGISVISDRMPVPVGAVGNPHDPNQTPETMRKVGLEGGELFAVEFSPQIIQSATQGMISTTHLNSIVFRVYDDKQTLFFNFYDEEFMGKYYIPTPVLELINLG